MKIIVIDREPIIASTLQDFLEDVGHEVRVIQSPDELFTNSDYADFHADVVLTETQQPPSSAQARIDAIANRYPRAAIFEMDNAPSLYDTERTLSRGVFGYVRKPIRLSELDLLLQNLDHFDSTEAKGASVRRRAEHHNHLPPDRKTGE